MTSYPNRRPPTQVYGATSHNSSVLSEAHRRMLFEESGLDPGVVAERGYYTARRAADVPQDRGDLPDRPGLVIPMFSPDGITRSYQLRPNRKGKGPKYWSPGGRKVIVDVHPRMLEEVRYGDGPILITEGGKTGDAATSRGIPTLVLAGVDMWNVPRVKPKRLRPCFDHVRLEGRPVYVCFDSDCMTKEGVQRALSEFVAALEARGATVKVIYLPDAPDGSKQGIDDYLVAGGTIKEMFILARKFEPADIGNIRMSRDEKLRALVGDLRARWWAEEWKGRGGHSERDVALKLIETAARSGKPHTDGVRVVVSWGVLQVEARVARRTLAKALARLEERGLLHRDNEGRKAEKTGAFVLRAKVDQYGERVPPEKKVTQGLQASDPDGLPLRALPEVPRLRWSRPKWKPTRKMIMEYRLRELSFLPAPRERIERLGKIRGAVVDALEVAGGELTLCELCEILHHKRPRDVRRRVLPMLEEAGVIETKGDVVRLAREWREELDSARKAGREASYEYTLEYTMIEDGVPVVRRDKVKHIGADELAETRRKLKSRAYRERDKAPVSKPSAAGLEAVRRSEEVRSDRLREIARAEEERRRAGPPPALEALVSRTLSRLDRMRMGLLCEVAVEEGFNRRDVPEAVRTIGYRVERLPEYGDAEFVFAKEVAA